jgi:hypothetical protein
MKNLIDNFMKVREKVNQGHMYSKMNKNLDDWNLLCVGLDNFENASYAMEYYEKTGIKSRDKIGIRFLKLYGFLQAIVIHQDSIDFILKMFEKYYGKKIIFASKSRNTLKNIRHLIGGHPNNKEVKGNYFRISLNGDLINTWSFQVSVWNRNNSSNTYPIYHIKQDYFDYKKDTNNVLEQILLLK